MKLEELKKVLHQVEPAAVLVSPRLLARVIQEVHKLPTQFLRVPHHRSFVIDRQVLFRHVEQDELDLDPDRMLPATVVLLVRPSAEDGDAQDRAKTLLYYWQRLFHASVDRALKEKVQAGKFSPTDVQARIAAIGAAEFDEIRAVLDKDLWLLPPVDDLSVYCEFVAVYLELRYFLPSMRSVYFPALQDFGKIDALIAQDVDGQALWRATRLPGAADPKVRGDIRSDDSHEYFHKLERGAQTAGLAKNHVRAAILLMKAARVAPGALTLSTRDAAYNELQCLTDRLRAALNFSEADAEAWQRALVSLLEKADQGHWTVEARLLYDLQQVCIDYERDVFKLDLVEWVLSAFKRPIKRPLPSQRLVQMTRHLNAAWQRIPHARLSDNDRQRLTHLLQAALQHNESRLRERMRPIFKDALNDAGLIARNPPEEVAFAKVIEELLDRITAAGFFTFGDLRDAISRNSLKLADLTDPQEFVRGDPLLRLDRRLSSLLDGVYRSGEFYLRGLARCTSLLFGTGSGRFLTLNILLPFGGAFLTLFGLEHILRKPIPFLNDFGLDVSLAPLWTFVPVGLFVLGIMYLPKLRGVCVQACRLVGEVARLAIKGPIWFLHLPTVQRVLKSWLFQLLWWYGVKPLIVALLIWLVLPEMFGPAMDLALLVGGAVLALNSRRGHQVSEVLWAGLMNFYDMLRSGLIPGLIRFVVQLLKQLMDGLERVLYSIDEWLRFRSGDTPISMVVRTILGVLWFPIGFFIRFYVVVLVEPMFHPLKLPFAILAAKIIYLKYGDLVAVQEEWLGHLFAPVVAGSLAWLNTWLLPNFFGFLFWEFRENWRLYRANRSPVLKQVIVGPHGESVSQLLKPGFHAGTVPRLFEHLRRAERVAISTGQWRTVRAYRQQLKAIEESMRLFVERDLLAILHQSKFWETKPLRPGKIELATQMVRIELEHKDFSREPARWAFAEMSGWLTVHIDVTGWLQKLSSPEREALATALAGWYKLAGMDVVREQVQATLAGRGLVYDVQEDGLGLRSTQDGRDVVVWPMHDKTPFEMKHAVSKNEQPHTLPSPDSLIFARLPIYWDSWVDIWVREKHGQSATFLPSGVALLPDGSAGRTFEVTPEVHNVEEANGKLEAMPAREKSEL